MISLVRNRAECAEKMEGARVLILTGEFTGGEGVCLGAAMSPGLWAISPDGSDKILSLLFEKDFGLLVDLSADPRLN
jgi:hypothetical protein